MKPHLILITLFQAKIVFSDEGTQKFAPTLPDCASPCKSKVGLSALEMMECIQNKCGSHQDISKTGDIAEFDAEEGEENDSQSPNPCVA
eukprot:CAMPEP_0196140126 /NCGR_PEP_ID=MMETSP0910-20130528/7151_1 /TAXON_ID=49265 /ORGANISM="Thalassiosira rotula, Strain GSO102" /LENGTH=88 /DNA_ID=CAMNT_0041400945 /DNA_START=124 /DNA_END=387 /DNA_ORIENTATION=+